MDFQKGQPVTVHLDEKHSTDGESAMHKAKFLGYHLTDPRWADVELEKEHAGKTRTLSVPISLISALLFLFLAIPARAQFVGYTSPQNSNQQLFAGQTTAARTPIPGASLKCTPTNGNPCGIRNLGQTFHYLTYVTSSAGCVFDLAMQASYDGTNFFNISSDASANNVLIGNGNASGGVSASGWFPVLAANITNISNCPSGISAFYSGSSSALNGTFGVFTQSSGLRQNVLQNNSLNGVLAITTLPTPANSSGGRIYLICTVTCGAGTDQFSVLDSGSPPLTQRTLATFTAANVTTLQIFTVPALTTPYVQIQFPSGNFTTTNASAYYEFDSPGSPATAANTYKEINSNATTQVRVGAGFLETIVVNNAGSAWTVQIFDNTACSGTAIAGATAFTVPTAGSTLRYNATFNAGLCILTAGTTPGSLTISYR